MSSGDSRIDALVWQGVRMNRFEGEVGTPMDVTYSFMGTEPLSGAYEHEVFYDFRSFDELQKMAVRMALNEFSAVSGLSFRESDTGGMLQYGLYAGRAGWPEDLDIAGEAMVNWRNDVTPARDVWINHSRPDYVDFQPAEGFGYFLLLHETAHTLGLKHPGEYGEHDTGPFLDEEHDHGGNTVMSYQQDFASGVALQEYDRLAFAYLYGPPDEPSADRYALSGPTLESLGLSVEHALAFMLAHLFSPERIAEEANAHGLSSGMLAELLEVDHGAVLDYFAVSPLPLAHLPGGAVDHLASRDITLPEAQAFIDAHLASPDVIHQAAREQAVSADMLAEIVGVQRGAVDDYFASHDLSLA